MKKVELSMGQKEVIRRGPSDVLEVLLQPNGMENFSAEVLAAADAKAVRAIKQIDKALQAPTRWFDSHGICILDQHLSRRDVSGGKDTCSKGCR